MDTIKYYNHEFNIECKEPRKARRKLYKFLQEDKKKK